MQILLVEDDNLLAGGIVNALKRNGFAVHHVATGATALSRIKAEPPDIVVLDLGLPDMDGLDLLRRVRAQKMTLPILILTARDALDVKVKGLDLGADDYLTKPFELDELLARLRVLERRLGNAASAEIVIGSVSLNTATYKLFVDGQDTSLSMREFGLLKALMENAGAIQTKQMLESKLYSWGEEVSSNTIEVHIHNLRKKLPANFIQTVRGIGYTVAQA
ncbi:MAG: response regulator [Spongiibacteraceae bacterium]